MCFVYIACVAVLACCMCHYFRGLRVNKQLWKANYGHIDAHSGKPWDTNEPRQPHPYKSVFNLTLGRLIGGLTFVNGLILNRCKEGVFL